MCRDVRLKNDPSIEVVRENAADDKVDGDDQNGGDSHSEKEEVNAISDGVKEGKVELGDGEESEEKCSAQLEEPSNKDKIVKGRQTVLKKMVLNLTRNIKSGTVSVRKKEMKEEINPKKFLKQKPKKRIANKVMRRMREEVVLVISSWSVRGPGRSCLRVRKGRL